MGMTECQLHYGSSGCTKRLHCASHVRYKRGCNVLHAQSVTKQEGANVNPDACRQMSMYVHLPFCKSQCHYCDFPIKVASRNASKWHEQLHSYIASLLHELHMLASHMQRPGRNGHPLLSTVFFGGGTPSLVPVDALHRVLQALDETLGIRSDAEISIEADPGTFTLATLSEYEQLGINRVSLGVQSFDEEMLRAIGRSHSLSDVHAAIEALHGTQLNWSLDLMASLPHLNEQKWHETLSLALDAQPQHISVYDLEVEEGTAFAHWYSPGQPPLPSVDTCEHMYIDASYRLQREGGFKHYEISNFALPGNECIHNLNYWNNNDWLALGMGAASSIASARLIRPRGFHEYIVWANSLREFDERLIAPKPSEEEVLLDDIMLKLRLSDGINLSQFGQRYGTEAAKRVEKAMQRFVHENKTRLYTSENERFAALNAPEGFIVSNDVISECFAELTSIEHFQSIAASA